MLGLRSPAPPAPDAAGSPALRPPPGHLRFPEFDGLRAIAACSVLLTHTASLSGFSAQNSLGVYTARMDVGVTIFFLISGFLLYRPFVAARLEGRPAIRIRDFCRRRVLRIVPAYWVALTLLAIWPGLLGMFGPDTWRFYAFTQNLSLDLTTQGIGPAWTLCIELTFYIALPFIATGIARLARGRRHPLRIEVGVIVLLALASMALRTALKADGGFYAIQTTLATYFDWFALGMLLAVASVAWHGREMQMPALRLIVRRPWIAWVLAAIAFWAVSTQLGLSRGFFLIYTDANYFGRHLLYAAVAFFLLLPAVFTDAGRAGGWPRWLLATPVLGWLGLVSYGIYLYHSPLVIELAERGAADWIPGSGLVSLTAVSLAVAVVCAAASYYLVERPALRFKEPRRPAPERASQRAATAPG